MTSAPGKVILFGEHAVVHGVVSCHFPHVHLLLAAPILHFFLIRLL